MDSLLLRHVTDEQPFLDDSSMYRFSPLDSEGRERYPKLGPPPVQFLRALLHVKQPVADNVGIMSRAVPAAAPLCLSSGAHLEPGPADS